MPRLGRPMASPFAGGSNHPPDGLITRQNSRKSPKNHLTGRGFEILARMPNHPKTNPSAPLSDSLFTRFFAPLDAAIRGASGGRNCPVLGDRPWLIAGILRAIEPVASGRDFLQRFPFLFPESPRDAEISRGHYFESLKSERRLRHVAHTAQRLADAMADPAHDPLASLPGLEDFDVYAGDGHWHEHATHDPRKPRAVRDESGAATGATAESHFAVGHLYGLNLRTSALVHLTAGDEVARRKEHDMRALKRLEIETLRQGARKGRKVLWIWDKAGIDFRQWHRWKQGSGIYFLSRLKENMKLPEEAAEQPWDREDPINAGVERDALAGSACGTMLRWVRYRDPISGRVFDFVTNVFDVPPGVIAQFYRMRWDIEKVFDDVKNKQSEKKAWATSAVAKSMQAQLICLAHNLMRLCERWLEAEAGIVNVPERRRRDKRVAELGAALAKQGLRLPDPWLRTLRFTQIAVKLMRWLRVYLFQKTCLEAALAALRHAYASL